MYLYREGYRYMVRDVLVTCPAWSSINYAVNLSHILTNLAELSNFIHAVSLKCVVQSAIGLSTQDELARTQQPQGREWKYRGIKWHFLFTSLFGQSASQSDTTSIRFSLHLWRVLLWVTQSQAEASLALDGLTLEGLVQQWFECGFWQSTASSQHPSLHCIRVRCAAETDLLMVSNCNFEWVQTTFSWWSCYNLGMLQSWRWKFYSVAFGLSVKVAYM